MKCNINRYKSKHSNKTLIDSTKNQPLNCIDLNDYFFHGIGTYLEPYQKINRLRAILDSKAILSESNQPDTFYLANALSQSPKCNGEDHISICQKESFLDKDQDSESFKLFVSHGISIILPKSIDSSLNVKNHFDPKDIWEWLDGEYRVPDEIPSEHFVGIGFPNRSLEEIAQSFHHLRRYSLDESIKHILNSDWFKDLSSINSCLEYNDIDLPIYSIVSGKQMGDLYSAFASVYGVNPNEVARICQRLQTPENERIGIYRDLSHRLISSFDFDDPFCK